MSQSVQQVWPDIIDERVDDQWWSTLRKGVEMMVKTRVQADKMHLWLNKDFLMMEKTSVPDEVHIGMTYAMNDPAAEAKPEEIKDMVPFIIKHLDESIFIADNSPLDFAYPDLQNMLLSIFKPEGPLQPGTKLVFQEKK